MIDQNDIIVTETRKSKHIPKIGITDIIAVASLGIIGILLIMSNPVPEYLVALVSLGAGVRVSSATSD